MKRSGIISLFMLVFLLVGSIFAVFFTYKQYQTSQAKDVALRQEIETNKGIIKQLEKEKLAKTTLLTDLQSTVEELQAKVAFKEVYYLSYIQPQQRVKGDTILFPRNSCDMYYGKLDGEGLELIHSLPQKDRLLDYEFTENGSYMLVYEVANTEENLNETKIEIFLGRVNNRNFKRVKQLNVAKDEVSQEYLYQGMVLSPDEKYFIIQEEIEGKMGFRLFEVKDLNEVEVVKNVTKQNVSSNDLLKFISFAGKDVIFFESVENGNLCLHRYNYNAGIHDSLILASIRSNYYQIDPMSGSGVVMGRNGSTGKPFFYYLSAEDFGNDAIGQFWD